MYPISAHFSEAIPSNLKRSVRCCSAMSKQGHRLQRLCSPFLRYFSQQVSFNPFFFLSFFPIKNKFPVRPDRYWHVLPK